LIWRHSLQHDPHNCCVVRSLASRGRFFTSSFFYCNETQLSSVFCCTQICKTRWDFSSYFFAVTFLLHVQKQQTFVWMLISFAAKNMDRLSRSLAVCLERIHNIKAFADLLFSLHSALSVAFAQALTRKHCILHRQLNATAACNLDRTQYTFCIFVKTTTSFSHTHT
jgi:hypothetical protein